MMAAQSPITFGNYFMATLNEAEKRIKRVLIFIRSSPRICLKGQENHRALIHRIADKGCSRKHTGKKRAGAVRPRP